jgi:hypothetical protein
MRFDESEKALPHTETVLHEAYKTGSQARHKTEKGPND